MTKGEFMKVELLDGVLKNQQHPDTFHIPSQKVKDALSSGDYVKVCDNNEKFWVELQSINGDELVGRVDNDLVFEHPFKCDDIITFEKRHVIGTL